MTDKTELLDESDGQSDTPEITPDDLQDGIDDDVKATNQKIFEQTFSKLMDGFGEACEAEGVQVAVAIARHPEIEQPLVFYRAPHIVDAGALMAAILREIKTDVIASLDTDPQ